MAKSKEVKETKESAVAKKSTAKAKVSTDAKPKANTDIGVIVDIDANSEVATKKAKTAKTLSPKKPKKPVDPYRLNLSHAKVAQTCYNVRSKEKNWVTEHGESYSITLFRKRIFKVILTEIMLAKGYKSVDARLRAEAILPGINLKSYSTILTFMYAYIYDAEFRDMLNYNIDRNIHKVLNAIQFYTVDYKPKITMLESNYSKVSEMKVVLTYLFEVLFIIRKYGLMFGKQSTVTRGTNSVLKDIRCKEFKEHYYFFHRDSKLSIIPCRKMDITQYTDTGNIYSCIDIVNQANYNTLIRLLTLKKMCKDAFDDTIKLAELHMIDYLIGNKINTPLSLYDMSVTTVVNEFGNTCKFDKEISFYRGNEYTNLDWWYKKDV